MSALRALLLALAAGLALAVVGALLALLAPLLALLWALRPQALLAATPQPPKEVPNEDQAQTPGVGSGSPPPGRPGPAEHVNG